jgi:hypothetical protein
MLSRLSRVLAAPSRLLGARRAAPCVAMLNITEQLRYAATTPVFGSMRRLHTSRPLFASEPAKISLEMPGDHAGRIVKWQKSVGDAVKEGDLLCIIETEVSWFACCPRFICSCFSSVFGFT